MKLARTIMLQGTASDVGKSWLAAALCRIFFQDGWKVAPFKSQNMSLNGYVTKDGLEIGRAQGMQADACRIQATTDMNPILLKPKKDGVSEVIVHGKPYRELDARTYREQYLPQAEAIVKEALYRLRKEYELVVIEGAGSPAEVNLKDRDIVNMRVAEWAEAPVLLVADIDRGGVFASLVGTMEILTPAERDRVAGFVINKFRGDRSLLQPGLDWLEQKTGKPVVGVVPYIEHLALESEDSLSLEAESALYADDSQHSQGPFLDIVVLRLPRMTHFSEFDPFLHEPDVRLRYISRLEQWGNPDAVIIPGSHNVREDLSFLQNAGLKQRLKQYAQAGGRIVVTGTGDQIMERMGIQGIRTCFHNDTFRRHWLNALREEKGWKDHPPQLAYARLREQAFDRLAQHVRQSLDLAFIKSLLV